MSNTEGPTVPDNVFNSNSLPSKMILFYYYIKSTSNYFEFAPTLNFGFQSNNFESKIRNERNHKSKKGMSVTSPGSTPMIQGNIGVRHGS